MDRLHRRSLNAGIAYKEFPARRDEFSVPELGESVAMIVERLVDLGPEAYLFSLFNQRISKRRPVRSRAVAPEGAFRDLLGWVR